MGSCGCLAVCVGIVLTLAGWAFAPAALIGIAMMMLGWRMIAVCWSSNDDERPRA